MSTATRTLHPRGFVLRIGPLSVIISPRLLIVSVALLALVFVLSTVAMQIGTMRLSFGEVVAAVFGVEADPKHAQIVNRIRIPRVVAAIFCGAALGVSGAVFQSVSRNALGSPDVIGFTTGAATGAIAQIVLYQAEPVQVSLSAVGGGLGTALIVYLLSVKGGVTGGYRLILVGIGVGAVLGALNGLMLVLGDLDNAVAANMWLAGSLSARTWTHAVPVMIGTLLLIPIVALLARRASMMEMSDDLAQQLGVRVERTRVWMMVLAVLLAGLAVGAAGPIAFVALAAPQLVTRLARTRGMPVVSAAAMGACILVAADVLSQTLPFDAVVPIGRMTGIIGGLYLIWLLTRSKQV
ncbi:FecCD family ABC transporter permease [Microbacterium sp.]|uniref:FecCD family ABC transporter permease n=1 Tax=Microbacterium sp. TaxID=51671 RepID=UPI0039E541C3